MPHARRDRKRPIKPAFLAQSLQARRGKKTMTAGKPVNTLTHTFAIAVEISMICIRIPITQQNNHALGIGSGKRLLSDARIFQSVWKWGCYERHGIPACVGQNNASGAIVGYKKQKTMANLRTPRVAKKAVIVAFNRKPRSAVIKKRFNGRKNPLLLSLRLA